VAAEIAASIAPVVSIQLVVSDLETTEAFYAGILDLPVRRVPTPPGAPEHLLLEREGWNLLFVPEDAVAEEHPILEDHLANFPKGIGVSLHFRVTGIESMFEAIVEEDLEVVYPLRSHPYGLKDVWCRDPDGYLVVLEETKRRG
jgi:catechol 2,3-dioxygenase-like lactoylglutathione lyase family enzyme